MSTSHHIPLPAARAWARKLREAVLPVCERAVVVGSIRRRREVVGDIELAVEPSLAERKQGDIFTGGETFYDTDAVLEALLAQDAGRTVVKAGSRYAQVWLGDHPERPEDRPTLDLFFCHPPAEWGAMLAIRTGPSDLSRTLVTRLREKGWRNKKMAVWRPARDDEPWDGSDVYEFEEGRFFKVPTPTEEAYFEACGVEYLPPERRDELAVNLQRGRT